MKTMLRSTLTGLLVGLALTPLLAAAEESAAEQAVQGFQAKMAALQEGGNLSWDTVTAAAREALDGLDVATLDVADIETLYDAQLVRYAEAQETFVPRLTEFASRADADGASAAAMLLAFDTGEDGGVRRELVTAALRHEGLPAALSQGRAGSIFGTLGGMPESMLVEVFDDLVGLSSYMTAELPPSVVVTLPNLLEGLLDLDGERFTRGCETLRANMVRATEGAIARTEDPNAREQLSGRLQFLNGAWARGELVGGIAPRLDFTWSTAGDGLTSLEDLRGKVVVLDFWATWCGPCVASFPKIRELAKRYEGYPVQIVGVTSLQGTHYAADGTATDTEGNPNLEYELMKTYVGEKNMTWTVAFAKQEVFNPEYGIRGIPHVVILDPEGRVRYRGLHPMEPGKEAKIDALLRESGLDAPPAATEASAKKGD